jgi:hypothetical protein
LPCLPPYVSDFSEKLMALRLLVDSKEEVRLDFNGRDPAKDLRNELSAVAAEGPFLFSGSDEGRGAECFEERRGGYVLKRRLDLGRLFQDMPKKGEADLEALDFSAGRLWLTGSHCLVRPKRKGAEPSGDGFDRQPSRHLLGSVEIDGKGRARRKTAAALPFAGKGSLRKILKRDPHIGPFVDLPTKENGLDVEGIVAVGRRLYLGLRGPVIATKALLIELPVKTAFTKPGRGLRKHFLDLGGLGVRDLAHEGGDILVLAGPVTSTGGPFRLFLWKRKKAEAALLHEWKLKEENPEGICFLDRGGRPGVLMLYDNPKERVHGSHYVADWFPLEAS